MIESDHPAAAGDKSWVVLQSLLCLLREKNLLTRADIEELCAKVSDRAAHAATDPLPCCSEQLAAVAASDLAELGDYIGRRYGGKHRRVF